MDNYFNPYAGFGLLPPTKKRKAYFAFHYDDIMRVNNVRNAWKIDHPDSQLNRSFQDSSLWESRKLEKYDSLKRLIREGVQYTSAVCVLIGTHTWSIKVFPLCFEHTQDAAEFIFKKVVCAARRHIVFEGHLPVVK